MTDKIEQLPTASGRDLTWGRLLTGGPPAGPSRRSWRSGDLVLTVAWLSRPTA